MQKIILLFTLFFVWCGFCSINANAQTEQVKVTIILNDATQHEYIISNEGKLSFANSAIVIDHNETVKPTFPLASIKKVLVSNYVSINETEIANIKIYPNPVQDYLQIANPANDNMKIEIFSISGESVYKTEFIGNKQIAISDFLAGTYLIKINNTFYKFTKL